MLEGFDLGRSVCRTRNALWLKHTSCEPVLSACLSVYRYIYICLSAGLSLYICLSHSLPLSRCMSLVLYRSLCLCLSLFPSPSISLSLTLSPSSLFTLHISSQLGQIMFPSCSHSVPSVCILSTWPLWKHRCDSSFTCSNKPSSLLHEY